MECVGLDAKKPLPFPASSVNAIYEQQMLYAFDADETRRFFLECHRILKPGGVIRVNEGDLRTLVERYLAGDGALVEYANRASYVRVENVSSPGDALSAIFKRWNSMRWLYDVQSLAGHLTAGGFASVAAAGFRESRLADIDALEKDNRDDALGHIWLEAVKP